MSDYPYFRDVHEDVREIARGAAEEFKKTAAEADETADYSIVERNLKRLGELGLLGLHMPEEYGGAGLDLVSHYVALEEIAKGCLATAFSYNTHRLAMDVINIGGTEEQKKKYLPPLCKDKIASFAITEPEAGSDAAAIKTRAKLEGNEYVLNGSKHFISNTIIADTNVLIAITDPEKKTRGFSGFIVEKGTPGLKIVGVEKKMGVKASPTTEYFLDNCRVPKENLLGIEGEGFSTAMQALEIARIGIGILGLGLSKAALQIAIAYAKERVQFGRPIIMNQAIQFHIADMASKIEAVENLLYHAAWLKDQGKSITKEASIAKLLATESCLFITDKAISILCGPGYTKDYPVERYHRDAKVLEMAAGTSEIQRLIISRQVVGKL